MCSIAVVGAGAVGGAVAAHLMAAGKTSVVLATRTPFDVLELETGEHTLRSRPAILAEQIPERPVDWVFVATKTYDAAAAATWIGALADRHTRVAVLQNGVEHVERFSPYVARSRLLPVVVELPAHRMAPGRVVQRGPARLTVPRTPAGVRFAELFTGTGVSVRTTSDFTTAAWTKLALNAAGAISAAALSTRLDMSTPEALRLARDVVGEAVAVGRAEGAALGDELVDRVISTLASQDEPRHPNSLHADRLAGRPMETDARNGAIVRIGRRHGIPTPANAYLVDFLTEKESAYSALDLQAVKVPERRSS